GDRAAEIDRLNSALVTKDWEVNERDETVRRLTTDLAEQRSAVATSTQRFLTLEAALAERQGQLASLRQTSWFKLGQAWDEERRPLTRIAKVTYHFMRGITPETWKRPACPIVARLKQRYGKAGKLGSMPALRPPVGREGTRSKRPRVLHVIANFMLGGSSRLVV